MLKKSDETIIGMKEVDSDMLDAGMGRDGMRKSMGALNMAMVNLGESRQKMQYVSGDWVSCVGDVLTVFVDTTGKPKESDVFVVATDAREE